MSRAAGALGPRSGRREPVNQGPGDRFGFELSGGLEAAAAARRAVIAGDGRLPTAVREDVLLLVSELVTNSVRHADLGPEEAIQVEVVCWPQRVRVEVVDPGTEVTPVRPRLSPDTAGGWGLVLVDRIAARWGVGRGPAFTRVWFELEF
jgi:anti-sigma regulatory factor (Ser/Thr protein kinase)